MGKGKRNRERRKQRATEDPDDVAALVGELLAATEEGQYLDLLRRRPALLSDEMLDHVAEMRDGVDFGVILELHRQLLLGSREDSRSAWRRFQEEGAALERRGQQLAPQLEVIELALSDGRLGDVIALSDAARPDFAAAGLSLAIGRMHAQRGLAYAQMADGDPRDNADRAVVEFGLALELSHDDEQRAPIGCNLVSRSVGASRETGRKITRVPWRPFLTHLRCWTEELRLTWSRLFRRISRRLFCAASRASRGRTVRARWSCVRRLSSTGWPAAIRGRQ
jgi:hypothetical protein